MRKFLQKLLILLAIILLMLAPRMMFQQQSFLFDFTSTATTFTKPNFMLEIPQKALFRNTVTVAVQATPGTTCELTYIPPSGKTSIMNTVAKEDGKCTWKWRVDETQGKGNGRLIFTINGISETHFIEIRSNF